MIHLQDTLGKGLNIKNMLIEENTPLLGRINTIRQLWKAVFSFPMVTDEKRHYIIQNSIYDNYSEIYVI